jgi:F-type H+-transporting ATPase subunit delta
MKERIAAKRYADAFVAYAEKTLGLPQIVSDFRNLDQVIFGNPEVESFLKGPEMEFKEKHDFIDTVFREGFSEEIRDFLKLLVDKYRFFLIRNIVDYIHERYGHGEAIKALVRTCRPLPKELVALIQEKIEKKFKRKFAMHLELDPGLVGGAQIVIGNTIMDGSLRKRLNELKEKLETVRVG